MENTAYECMIVVDAKLNETKREELIGRFKKMAGDQTTVEKMGQKKYGFYYLLNFRATSDVPAKMTALMNITEGVDRYLFIAKTDISASFLLIKIIMSLKIFPEKILKLLLHFLVLLIRCGIVLFIEIIKIFLV